MKIWFFSIRKNPGISSVYIIIINGGSLYWSSTIYKLVKLTYHCSVLNLQATILLNLFLDWFSCFSLCTHDLLLRWTLFKLCWWKKNYYSKDTIIITCKLYDQVLPQNVCYSSNKFDHSPPTSYILVPKVAILWPAPWIKSSGWGQNRKSHKNRLSALEIWKNTWVTVTTCYTNGRLPVFSLNFSSARKGPFMAGKAVPEAHFPWGTGAMEWGKWLRLCCEI